MASSTVPSAGGPPPLKQPDPPADRQRIAASMSERELLDQVVHLARMFGWIVVHFGGNMHGRAWYDATGFPDLLLIKDALVWFRELKTEKGKLSPHQQRWQERLTADGLNHAVWRPSDLDDIAQALSCGMARMQ